MSPIPQMGFRVPAYDSYVSELHGARSTVRTVHTFWAELLSQIFSEVEGAHNSARANLGSLLQISDHFYDITSTTTLTSIIV